MSDPIAALSRALEGRYRVERELGEGGMVVGQVDRRQNFFEELRRLGSG